MKKNWHCHPSSLLALVLAAGLSLTTWKMLHFRDGLRQITQNDRWEHTLSLNKFYDDDVTVLFGDSQIALWPMAPSFGTLPIVNRGKSGDWASWAVNRFDKDVISLQPKSVLILIGTNDLGNGQSIDSIIMSIETMLLKAGRHKISIVLCSLLPVRNEYTVNHRASDLLLVNSRLASLARHYDADFVDLYSALSDETGMFDSHLTSDGLHPNRQGYLKMSRIVLPYLLKNILKSGI